MILFLCLKAFTSQAEACYVPAFLLGTSLANLCAAWGRRVLVHALLPGTRRYTTSISAAAATATPSTITTATTTPALYKNRLSLLLLILLLLVLLVVVLPL